jgi:hypothetical protein
VHRLTCFYLLTSLTLCCIPQRNKQPSHLVTTTVLFHSSGTTARTAAAFPDTCRDSLHVMTCGGRSQNVNVDIPRTSCMSWVLQGLDWGHQGGASGQSQLSTATMTDYIYTLHQRDTRRGCCTPSTEYVTDASTTAPPIVVPQVITVPVTQRQTCEPLVQHNSAAMLLLSLTTMHPLNHHSLPIGSTSHMHAGVHVAAPTS